MADAVAKLNSLLRGTGIADHEEALRLATTAAKAGKSPESQQVRVVALLKLDRYAEALAVLEAGGAALEAACPLEKAYALYKTGALDATEPVLERALQQVDDAAQRRGLQHMAAQVAYRSEQFETAAAIYRQLAGAAAGEENDLRINLLAAHAQLEWQGKGRAVPEDQKKPDREELEAFETAYNAACGCLGRGDFARASILLTRARDLCQASEDLDEDEKKAELIPILVQQSYALTKLGKLDEAEKVRKSVVLAEIPDGSTRMVAGSIAVALTAEKNAFMAQRVAESVPQTAPQNDRLFGYQAAVLHRNKYAIELQAQKFPGVKRATTKLLSQESLPSIAADKVSLGVMRAAAHCRMQSGKESLRQLLSLLDANPNDVGLLLTVIQLYVQLSNPVPAVALLEAFFKRLEAGTTPDHADVRFAPGLVSVAVALFRLQGRPSAIRAELARAAAHWQRKRGKASSAAAAPSRISTYDSLLRVAGIELLQSSNPADLATAGHAFEQLVRANPHDRAARAGLVASFATVDFARVQPHLDGLTPVDELVAGVDAETLLEAGVAVLDPKPAGQKRGPDEGGAAKQQQQQAPKRRRRNKPAKNAVEGRAPDPERWLPLRDRSSYRPKGKKGKKRAAEATQGGVVREEETLELAGGAGSVRVEKAPAGGSGGGGGGGGGKKKKGKK